MQKILNVLYLYLQNTTWNSVRICLFLFIENVLNVSWSAANLKSVELSALQINPTK